MRRPYLLLLSLLSLSFCTKKKGESQLLHENGRVLNDNSPYQWVDASEAEFKEYVVPLLSGRAATEQRKYLAKDHPMRQRVQYWVDTIDSHLRQRVGAAFANVPKPIAEVELKDVWNASVAGFPVCLKIPVQVGASTDRREDYLTFTRKNDFFLEKTDGISCIPSKLSADEQFKALKWHLGQMEDCSLQFENGVVKMNTECMGDEEEEGIYPGINVVMVLNRIFVNAGLVKEGAEEELPITLTHELAHYYMAHIIQPQASYETYYRLGTANLGIKPEFDAKVQEYGENFVDTFFGETNRALGSYYKLESATFDTSLFFFIESQVEKAALKNCPAQKNCQDPCSKAMALEKVGTFSTKHKPKDESLKQYYLNFEALAIQCMANLELSLSEKEIDKVDRNVAESLDLKPTSGNLLKIVKGWDAGVMELRKKKEKLQKDAATYGLAQYTVEQEADELGNEWSIAVGIDPRAVIEAKLSMNDRKADPKEISPQDCRALYKNGWRDAQGEKVLVPVGAWRDPHHSGCFRAFNMDREIQTHRYKKVSVERKTPAGPTWEELQKSINKELKELPK